MTDAEPGTEAQNDGAVTAATSRRRFLRGSAIGAAGVAVGAAAGFGITEAVRPAETKVAPTAFEIESARANRVVDFYGPRQAGVVTPQQDRLMFATFDLTTTDVDEVARLLGRWSAMAARFTEGKLLTDAEVRPGAAPYDTGEAMDLGPYSLTITVGFGPSLFDDRFGLKDKMPAALKPLTGLAGDSALRPELSDGDLCIQACADDPQVVFHAIRNMSRAARGTAVLRWSQLGFGRASATGAGQSTPRNLFGFKDGTNNIHADDTPALADHVWVGEESDQDWMVDGSYLVARKIRMEIEQWDTDNISDQERIFGRIKTTGAPLTGGDEFTPIDFQAKDDTDAPVIDIASHVRLSSPEENNGIRILRRGYNYTDGQDSRTGKLAAGLFFISFQQHPDQFRVLQNRLGSNDSLNEYIAHIGSGLFACPPGVSASGDWFGKALFT